MTLSGTNRQVLHLLKLDPVTRIYREWSTGDWVNQEGDKLHGMTDIVIPLLKVVGTRGRSDAYTIHEDSQDLDFSDDALELWMAVTAYYGRSPDCHSGLGAIALLNSLLEKSAKWDDYQKGKDKLEAYKNV